MKFTLGFFGACALACWTLPCPAAGAAILLIHGHVYTGNPLTNTWNRRTDAVIGVYGSNTRT